MGNKFNAVLEYRSLVSYLIHGLLLCGDDDSMSLTAIASEIHLSIGQCSRAYHCVCSLSPEKFLKLCSLYQLRYGSMMLSRAFFSCVNKFDNGTL